ncbi:MAG: glycosyltransferase family 39 protein [Candidatus Omnitrophota bacterium]
MIIKTYLKAKPVILILGSIIIFYILNNYIWLRESIKFPFFFYYAFDFEAVPKLYNHLINFDLYNIIRQFQIDDNTSIYSLSAALTTSVFGKSLLTMHLLNNIFYFAVTLISIYLIGQMTMNRKTGLLAAAIFALYPAIYGTSRLYVVEFGVMASVAFSVWCLLKTENFSNRKFSLLLGIAAGWGMLIKYSFLGFFIGPLIYIAARSLGPFMKNFTFNRKELLTRILNIIFFISLNILVISFHYFNLYIIKRYLLRPIWFASYPWYEFRSLRISILGFFEQQLSLFFFAVFIFGLFYFIKKDKSRQGPIFVFWFLIPWLTLILMPHDRFTHYVIPYLPAIALISAVGLMQFFKTRRVLKITLISLILIVGIIQYYDFSFGTVLNLNKLKVNINGKDTYYYTLTEDICSPPIKDKVYDKIISSIQKKSNKTANTVLIMPDANFYTNNFIWRCIAWFRDLPFKVILYAVGFDFVTGILDELKQADFILYSGYLDVRDPSYLDQTLERSRKFHVACLNRSDIMKFDYFLEENLQNFKAQFQEAINNFKLVDEFTKDKDDVGVYLYQKI